MKQKGFTLLEVLVSATIIAVLTVIGVVTYSSVNKRSRDVKRKSDLEQIRSALEMYRADTSAYPNIAATYANVSGLAGDLVPTYIPAISADPDADKAYLYLSTDTNSDGIYDNYCICGVLETLSENTTQSTCTISLPQSITDCNYGLKNP